MKYLPLLLLLFVSPAFSQQVEEVLFEGNTKITDEALRQKIATQPGSKLSSGKITQDIKSLFSLGYFGGISVYESDGKIIFRLDERPAIKNVTIEGNDQVDVSTLKEFLVPEDRRYLSEKQIKSGIEKAILHYQSKGYYEVDIDYEVVELDKESVEIAYKVSEGAEQLIREILISGNAAIDEDEILDAIQLSEYSWYSSWLTGSGRLDKNLIDIDITIITRLYLEAGFVDIKVAEPLVDELEDGLRVTYRLTEGEIHTFGSVAVSDEASDLVDEPVSKRLESEAGDTFNVKTLQDDVFRVSSVFTDEGFAFVNVEPRTSIDRQNKKVNLVYEVNRGPQVSIGKIRIRGNNKTQDNVIRRSLSIDETDIYSGSKVDRSKQLLDRLGYFEAVDLTTEKTDRDDVVDLLVNVKETSTGQFSAGVGVSSNDGVLFNLNYSESNLFGTGNRFSVVLNTGNVIDNYIVSFRNPRVNDTRWSFGVAGRISEVEFDDFRRGQDGGSVSFGYPLWFLGEEYLDDIRFSVEYEFLSVEISDVEEDAAQFVIDEEGKTTSSSITPRLVRDTINNPIFPTAGSRQVLSLEYAGVGGREEFIIAEASNTFYYTLFESSYGQLILSNRTSVAYGDSLNSDRLPLFKRFFGGGINSVRSFDARDLGPRDENGQVFGGSKRLVSNVEIIFPLVESAQLSGVVFFDIGNSFNDDDSIDFAELERAVGWGIRWRSPLAPLRFEVGYPIGGGEGSATTTHFSFGAPL